MSGGSRINAPEGAPVDDNDYISSYVDDPENVVDIDAIRSANVKIGIDPLGGAAVHYWEPIVERYKIAASVVNDAVDPTFRFMTVDWDGKIRMDCSSPYAMTRLIASATNSISPSPTTPTRIGTASSARRGADEPERISRRGDFLFMRTGRSGAVTAPSARPLSPAA